MAGIRLRCNFNSHIASGIELCRKHTWVFDGAALNPPTDKPGPEGKEASVVWLVSCLKALKGLSKP